MVSCAACGLAQTPKTKDQGISFHQFPNGQRGESWTKFVQNIRCETDWTQKAKSCLCSRHFNESCFDRTSKVLIRLQPTAIPTIIVDRVKYQRCEEEVIARPTQNLMLTPDPDPSTTIVIEISPSVSGLGNNEDTSADTPRERELKRKIEELSARDIIKSKNILKLQEVICKQKKQIASLKQVTMALKTKHKIKQINLLSSF